MPITLPGALRVLLVEDSPLIREHLVELVERVGGLRVAGTVDTAVDAIAAVEMEAPHIVVLDVVLRSGSGIDVLRALQGRAANPVIVVFTNSDSAAHERLCRAAGADWFLSKAAGLATLEEVLRTITGRLTKGTA